jgi:hypothetical protein
MNLCGDVVSVRQFGWRAPLANFPPIFPSTTAIPHGALLLFEPEQLD